jgi:hypothetical protein
VSFTRTGLLTASLETTTATDVAVASESLCYLRQKLSLKIPWRGFGCDMNALLNVNWMSQQRAHFSAAKCPSHKPFLAPFYLWYHFRERNTIYNMVTTKFDVGMTWYVLVVATQGLASLVLL